jgi:hypothetical protein
MMSRCIPRATRSIRHFSAKREMEWLKTLADKKNNHAIEKKEFHNHIKFKTNYLTSRNMELGDKFYNEKLEQVELRLEVVCTFFKKNSD